MQDVKKSPKLGMAFKGSEIKNNAGLTVIAHPFCTNTQSYQQKRIKKDYRMLCYGLDLLCNFTNQQLFFIKQTSMRTSKNHLSMRMIILTLTLLQLVSSAFDYYDVSNTNNTSGNLSALITLINNSISTCTSSPPSRLTLCNNTCQNCLSNSPAKCSSCSEGYFLDTNNCMINQTNFNYTYFPYIGMSKAQAQSTISNFRYTSSNASLTSNRIIGICQASSYELYAAGVFTASDVINLQFFRTDPIDQIQIKLNLLTLVQNVTFYITLNDNTLFSKSFSGADLSGSYVQNNNTNELSYLSLAALNSTSASSIFVPIDTDLISYITSQYTIKLFVKTNSTKKYVWAFNDLVIFQRDCQTCVTKAVSQLMNSTSLSVLFTLIIVIVLVIILNLAMVYEQYERKKEFQAKLGATSGNLPHKAIDRVLQALTKAKKLREKQMSREFRDYTNAKKILAKKQEDEGKSAVDEEKSVRQFSAAAKKADSMRQV